MEKLGIANILLARKAQLKKKRGGIMSEVSEQRALTADFLKIPIKQVCGLTRGWTKQQLFDLLKESQNFKANPQALWWKKYKELKKIYGRKDKKDLCEVGKKGGNKKQREGQAVLF